MRVKSLLLLTSSLVLLAGCGSNQPSVIPDEVISISIDTEPTKVSYKKGEKLDPTGLIIEVNKTNGSETLSYQGHESEFTFKPSLDKELEETDTSVKVTYRDKNAFFTIAVEKETAKYTISFAEFDLGGVEQIQSKDPQFNTQIKSFLNEKANNHISEFTSTSDNRVRLENSVFAGEYGSIQALILASKKSEGSINITFNQKLKAVTIKAQQYFNITPGYQGDDHVYPTYDGVDPYTGSSELSVNDQTMEIQTIDYEYDLDGFPIINIPPVCVAKFEIDSLSLLLTAYAANRVRIHELTLEFEE